MDTKQNIETITIMDDNDHHDDYGHEWYKFIIYIIQIKFNQMKIWLNLYLFSMQKLCISSLQFYLIK